MTVAIIEQALRIRSCRPDEGGRLLCRFADEFRSGRPIADLLVLLDSDNPELVMTGTYVLAEVQFERYAFPEFLDRLRALAEHDHKLVRFYASNALFPERAGDTQ